MPAKSRISGLCCRVPQPCSHGGDAATWHSTWSQGSLPRRGLPVHRPVQRCHRQMSSTTPMSEGLPFDHATISSTTYSPSSRFGPPEQHPGRPRTRAGQPNENCWRSGTVPMSATDTDRPHHAVRRLPLARLPAAHSDYCSRSDQPRPSETGRYRAQEDMRMAWGSGRSMPGAQPGGLSQRECPGAGTGSASAEDG